ncbi:uncharacterized protein K452DRAFT_362533 [Neofusicoccum parvum]|uniref:Uncharacterized protein K452DRAFT_362533 n=1 Tax=Neofusicoccum parvum TaxID=310453 RepID=A0ACB5S2M4_9PEZI|nr:uncharacterized protein K452DRAFT_362533 [Neofusicoccum parvum]
MGKMRMRWEKKPEADAFAKARQYLRKVGDTINNHSNTLKMLPSSNDYASVFCGALNVFIKASSNYSKLSEEFGRAMTEINDSIATVHEQVLQHKDEIGMRHLVLRFYCQIFAFLINAMKWYTDKKRKRLLRSLNENLYSQYQEQILEVRRLSDEMHKRSMNRKLTDMMSATARLHERLKFQTELQENDRRFELM